MENWIYEAGREIPEVLGSGSEYSFIAHTNNEKEAFKLMDNKMRNYLIRSKHKNGKRIVEWYDFEKKEWKLSF